MRLWVIAAVLLSVRLAAAEVGPASAPPDRWPVFRGNLQMTGLAGTTLPAALELLWSFKTGDSIEASCAVADGVVYQPTMDGRLFAIGLADGKEHWQFVNPDKDPIKSSPGVDEQAVYYGDDVGNLRAIDRQTGKERWKFSTNAEIICSPTIVDGKVVFGSYDECLYCLEAKTGAVVWKFQTAGPVHCSPSLLDGQIAVAGCDGFVRLVRMKDGKESGSLELGGNIASTPAVVGQRMFIGTMGNEVVCVDGKGLTRVWAYENPRQQFPYFSSAAVVDDLVLIGGRDKLLHAIDQKSGKARWTFPTRGKVDSSPVVASGRVYFGSADGTIYGVDLASGQKQWEYVVGNPVVAAPAAVSGRLLIGDQDGTLYCFGKP